MYMYIPTFCTVLAVYIHLYVVQCCCQYMYVRTYVWQCIQYSVGASRDR